MNKRKRKRIEKQRAAEEMRLKRLGFWAGDLKPSGKQARYKALRETQAGTAFQERHGLIKIAAGKKRRRRTSPKLDVWWRLVRDCDTSSHPAMPYAEYLKTAYWKAIRQIKFAAASRQCQRCPASRMLQVHHKSYEYRGREHLALHTLEVLCRACHRKEHGLT